MLRSTRRKLDSPPGVSRNSSLPPLDQCGQLPKGIELGRLMDAAAPGEQTKTNSEQRQRAGLRNLWGCNRIRVQRDCAIFGQGSAIECCARSERDGGQSQDVALEDRGR